MKIEYPGHAGAYSPLNFRHELIALYDFRPNDADGFFLASSARASTGDFKAVGLHGAVFAQLDGSNTANDYAKIAREQNEAIELGIGAYMLDMISYVDTAIPNTSHKSKFYIGLGVATATNPLIDGMWFEYDENDANWQCVTAVGGSETKTDSGVAVSASTKYNMKIVINAAATSVEFFINDISIGVHTTNITAVLLTLIVYAHCHTTHSEAGAAALVVDAFCEYQALTTPR